MTTDMIAVTECTYTCYMAIGGCSFNLPEDCASHYTFNEFSFEFFGIGRHLIDYWYAKLILSGRVKEQTN